MKKDRRESKDGPLIFGDDIQRATEMMDSMREERTCQITREAPEGYLGSRDQSFDFEGS